ncbi:MAG: hypothetical protein P8L24_01745 [Cytophagales bacterium]|nr:hypothetical protein [Cytophagales bacterium]
MKKIYVFLFIILISSCEKESDNVIPDEFKFNLNVHNSLNSSWQNEFGIIMDNLNQLIPVQAHNYLYELDVYAWNDNVSSPYKSEIGDYSGACICGNDKRIFMVLEINNEEFTWNSMHRFSVVVHEYFHVYQMSLSKEFYDGNIELKWLSEGTAASFESLYIQQFYSTNYFLEAQTEVDISAINNTKIYEKFSSSSTVDRNYSSSVFIVLALVKELQKLGKSEEESFKLIYKDFWEKNPTDNNWKNKFQEVFGISVDMFYNELLNYSANINDVLPSETLKIENIFND